jgi:hypothetical protein
MQCNKEQQGEVYSFSPWQFLRSNIFGEKPMQGWGLDKAWFLWNSYDDNLR